MVENQTCVSWDARLLFQPCYLLPICPLGIKDTVIEHVCTAAHRVHPAQGTRPYLEKCSGRKGQHSVNCRGTSRELNGLPVPSRVRVSVLRFNSPQFFRIGYRSLAPVSVLP